MIRNTHFGLYITEKEEGKSGVKPLRFGELSVIASSITLHRYTLIFAPRIYLKMIINIKYESTIIKKRKWDNLVFHSFFPSHISNFTRPSPG